MAEALLAIDRLNKRFLLKDGVWGREHGQVVAARDVSLTIERGETLGLVGESGCGKTTLSRMILGLERPDSGGIAFEGVDLLAIGARQRREICADLQVIFQDPFGSLNPRRTIGQSVAEPLKIHGRGDRQSIQAQTVALLEKVGIDASQLKRYPHQFSGGQRQRIALARAMMLNPKIVVADEPTSALDVSIQAQVLNLFMDLQEQYGTAYVFISHNLSVVEHVADDIMVMYLGRVVEHGNSETVFAKPLHPYTQALLSAAPSLKEQKVQLKLAGELPSPLNPPSGCALHQRCPHAQARCAQEVPELREWQGRKVACLRLEEIAV